MEKFVRILAFILLLGTTAIFIMKIFTSLPIAHSHLFILFMVGVISLFWANWRENRKEGGNE